MLKSRKILLSLVVVALLIVTFGSVKSLATQPIVPTVESSADTNNTANNIPTISITATNNTTNNTANNVANNTANKVTNNTANNVANSTSYNKTNTTGNKTSLPYAGTNSTVVFVVIALVISSVYAYKKVSDYNI